MYIEIARGAVAIKILLDKLGENENDFIVFFAMMIV